MSKNVVAAIREDAPFVPAGRYYLFSEPAAWTLMPTDEGSGQLPLTLDKGAYTLTADPAPTAPGMDTKKNGCTPARIRVRCFLSR